MYMFLIHFGLDTIGLWNTGRQELNFSHTSDLPPCREQLWDDMHFVWFSMWDGFFSPRVHSTALVPPESRSDEGGIRWRVVRNSSHMEHHTKCIFSHTYTLIKLNTLCKVSDHETHVRWIYLTTVLCMGEGQKVSHTCTSDLPHVENSCEINASHMVSWS